MYLSYVGAGYHGMQRTPGTKTIEGDLIDAFLKSGAVAEINIHEPRKFSFSRAARTDRGVSALGQVVGAKLVLDPPGLVQRMNEHLPPAIRCLGVVRVINSFNARRHCDYRRYEYLLPTYAFDPAMTRGYARQVSDAACGMADASSLPSPPSATPSSAAGPSSLANTGEDAQSAREGEDRGNAAGPNDKNAGAITFPTGGPASASTNTNPSSGATSAHPDDSTPASAPGEPAMNSSSHPMGQLGSTSGTGTAGAAPGPSQPAQPAPAPFVFDEACRRKVERLLSLYRGTHNFHNFTIERKPSDPSAARHMRAFSCSKPFTINVSVPAASEAHPMTDARDQRPIPGSENGCAMGKPGPSAEVGCVAGTQPMGAASLPAGSATGTPMGSITDSQAGSQAGAQAGGPTSGGAIRPQEYVALSVVGQSFMQHQIRKMVGLLVAVMQGVTDESSITRALESPERVFVPIAPSLGLYLVETMYESYNKEYGTPRGLPLTLASFDSGEVEAFRVGRIYGHMAATEARSRLVSKWLADMPYQFANHAKELLAPEFSAQEKYFTGKRPSREMSAGGVADRDPDGDVDESEPVEGVEGGGDDDAGVDEEEEGENEEEEEGGGGGGGRGRRGGGEGRGHGRGQGAGRDGGHEDGRGGRRGGRKGGGAKSRGWGRRRYRGKGPRGNDD
eukprot:jgi/Mesvir1/21187/Mv08647-RA.1